MASMGKKALVIEPHDDDLIIGMGGTALQLLQNDWKIRTVQMTDGRHGHNEIPPEELVEIRKQEKEDEIDYLNQNFNGSIEWSYLGLEDGNLNSLNYSRTASQISGIIDEFEPDYIFYPSNDEAHPDHRATHEIITASIEQASASPVELYYIVWQIPFHDYPMTNVDSVLKIDIDTVFQDKLDIIEIHESQEEVGGYTDIIANFNRYLASLYKALGYEAGKQVEAIASSSETGDLDELLEDLEGRVITDFSQGRESEDIR